MSLITQCPACGTMFKVVPDQLKVSQGWVRCGQCGEVFDAPRHLQPFEPSAASDATSGMRSTKPIPDGDSSLSSSLEAGVMQDEAPVSAHPAGPPSGLDEFDPLAWKQANSDWLNESGTLRRNESGDAVHVPIVERPDLPVEEPQANASGFAADASPSAAQRPMTGASPGDVSFIRQARRRAVWRRPAVRLGVGAACLLLAAMLLLQVLWHQRDGLVAAEPRLKPLLVSMCSILHCELGQLRRIESVVIDSSSFNKLEADVYRLGFALKNTGTLAVAMPSLEVTLTDTQDQAVLRRVLSPAQLGAADNPLQAGSDFTGAMVIQVAGADPQNSPGAGGAALPALHVAGYRMLAFYP